MINPELADHIIAQGKVLVRAVAALATIEPSGPFERVLATVPATDWPGGVEYLFNARDAETDQLSLAENTSSDLITTYPYLPARFLARSRS